MEDFYFEYYKHYIKGKYLFSDATPESYRMALDEFLKALECKECRQIYQAIFDTCKKLNDVDNSINYARKLFEYGDVSAMYFLGLVYSNEKFGKLNNEKAYQCFEKCVENKYIPGYLSIAKMYLNGVYVKKSEKKYLEYLKEALTIGNNGDIGEVLEELGKYYYSINECTLAVKYFKKSIENGWIHSNYYLALCYRYGYGVEICYEKFFEHLSNCFCRESYVEIAALFSHNELINSDDYIFIKSIMYLANLGDPAASIVLGAYYSQQSPCDEKLVKYWLDKGFSIDASDDAIFEKKVELVKKSTNPQFHEIIDEMAKKYLELGRFDA